MMLAKRIYLATVCLAVVVTAGQGPKVVTVDTPENRMLLSLAIKNEDVTKSSFPSAPYDPVSKINSVDITKNPNQTWYQMTYTTRPRTEKVDLSECNIYFSIVNGGKSWRNVDVWDLKCKYLVRN